MGWGRGLFRYFFGVPLLDTVLQAIQLGWGIALQAKGSGIFGMIDVDDDFRIRRDLFEGLFSIGSCSNSWCAYAYPELKAVGEIYIV